MTLSNGDKLHPVTTSDGIAAALGPVSSPSAAGDRFILQVGSDGVSVPVKVSPLLASGDRGIPVIFSDGKVALVRLSSTGTLYIVDDTLVPYPVIFAGEDGGVPFTEIIKRPLRQFNNKYSSGTTFPFSMYLMQSGNVYNSTAPPAEDHLIPFDTTEGIARLPQRSPIWGISTNAYWAVENTTGKVIYCIASGPSGTDEITSTYETGFVTGVLDPSVLWVDNDAPGFAIEDGTIKAWIHNVHAEYGYNLARPNLHGEYAQGTSEPFFDAYEAKEPLPAYALPNMVSIMSPPSNSGLTRPNIQCAVDEDGGAWVWGLNQHAGSGDTLTLGEGKLGLGWANPKWSTGNPYAVHSIAQGNYENFYGPGVWWVPPQKVPGVDTAVQCCSIPGLTVLGYGWQGTTWTASNLAILLEDGTAVNLLGTYPIQMKGVFRASELHQTGYLDTNGSSKVGLSTNSWHKEIYVVTPGVEGYTYSDCGSAIMASPAPKNKINHWVWMRACQTGTWTGVEFSGTDWVPTDPANDGWEKHGEFFYKTTQQTFVGTGADDMFFSMYPVNRGSLDSRSHNGEVLVEITSLAPDRYKVSSDNGVTWGSPVLIVPKTIVALGYGLSIYFDTDTGHVVGDVWRSAQPPAAITHPNPTVYHYHQSTYASSETPTETSPGANDAVADVGWINFYHGSSTVGEIKDWWGSEENVKGKITTSATLPATTPPTPTTSRNVFTAEYEPFYTASEYYEYAWHHIDDPIWYGGEWTVLLIKGPIPYRTFGSNGLFNFAYTLSDYPTGKLPFDRTESSEIDWPDFTTSTGLRARKKTVDGFPTAGAGITPPSAPMDVPTGYYIWRGTYYDLATGWYIELESSSNFAPRGPYNTWIYNPSDPNDGTYVSNMETLPPIPPVP